MLKVVIEIIGSTSAAMMLSAYMLLNARKATFTSRIYPRADRRALFIPV